MEEVSSVDVTFEALQGVSLAGSKSFFNGGQALMRSDTACCILGTQPEHKLHQLQVHILNTDLVNYNLRTLSLMQFNGKQATCQHTSSTCMCSGLRSTKVSTAGIGCPVDVTPRMRMVLK